MNIYTNPLFYPAVSYHIAQNNIQTNSRSSMVNNEKDRLSFRMYRISATNLVVKYLSSFHNLQLFKDQRFFLVYVIAVIRKMDERCFNKMVRWSNTSFNYSIALSPPFIVITPSSIAHRTPIILSNTPVVLLLAKTRSAILANEGPCFCISPSRCVTTIAPTSKIWGGISTKAVV